MSTSFALESNDTRRTGRSAFAIAAILGVIGLVFGSLGASWHVRRQRA
jgi:hypothetical protein